MSNSTKNQTTEGDLQYFEITWDKVLVGIVLYVIILVTLCGNILVLLAVKINRKLQTSFNYYIVNLAITDVAVAVTAMSFQATHIVLGYWPFGEVLCAAWIFFDYGMTFVSVFTLILISVDRFWSVTWSLHYRRYHTKKWCIVSIGIAWAFMLLLWVPPWLLDRLRNSKPGECFWDPSLNQELVYVVATLGHHGPFFIMMYCYAHVAIFLRRKIKLSVCLYQPGQPTTSQGIATKWNNNIEMDENATDKLSDLDTLDSDDVQDHNRNQSEISYIGVAERKKPEVGPRNQSMRSIRLAKEKKVFVTLSYIIICYGLLWLPFHVVFDITIFKPSLVPDLIWHITFWMTYINSTVNPLVYTLSTSEFRAAFLNLLKCKSNAL